MPRRSTNVQLIALGTVILSGCGPDLPKDRYVYSEHGACVNDWGEENCEHSPGSHSGYGGHYCYGPRYNSSVWLPNGQSVWTGNASTPAVHPTTGQRLGASAVHVARGGFGSFGRSFSSFGG